MSNSNQPATLPQGGAPEDNHQHADPKGDALPKSISESRASLRINPVEALKLPFIEDRPKGMLSLPEVAEYLKVSPEFVAESLNHSLAHYESSDKQRYYDPYFVEQHRLRIADLRKKFEQGQRMEQQRHQEAWSAESIRKLMKGNKK